MISGKAPPFATYIHVPSMYEDEDISQCKQTLYRPEVYEDLKEVSALTDIVNHRQLANLQGVKRLASYRVRVA